MKLRKWVSWFEWDLVIVVGDGGVIVAVYGIHCRALSQYEEPGGTADVSLTTITRKESQCLLNHILYGTVSPQKVKNQNKWRRKSLADEIPLIERTANIRGLYPGTVGVVGSCIWWDFFIVRIECRGTIQKLSSVVVPWISVENSVNSSPRPCSVTNSDCCRKYSSRVGESFRTSNLLIMSLVNGAKVEDAASARFHNPAMVLSVQLWNHQRGDRVTNSWAKTTVQSPPN